MCIGQGPCERNCDAGVRRACRAIPRKWEGMGSRTKRGTHHPIIIRVALEKVRTGQFVVLVQRDEGAVA